MDAMRPGDLVVALADDVEAVLACVRDRAREQRES
jgi:hypothetical protein